jgi:hypothetical protein
MDRVMANHLSGSPLYGRVLANHLSGSPLYGRFLSSLANIRLFLKYISGTNTLAYLKEGKKV